MNGAYTDQERVELARKEYAKINQEEVVKIPTADGTEKTIGIVSQKSTTNQPGNNPTSSQTNTRHPQPPSAKETK